MRARKSQTARWVRSSASARTLFVERAGELAQKRQLSALAAMAGRARRQLETTFQLIDALPGVAASIGYCAVLISNSSSPLRPGGRAKKWPRAKVAARWLLVRACPQVRRARWNFVLQVPPVIEDGGRSMPGPRPTPTHLRLLRGNPSKRSVNRNEPQPPIPPEVPEPPDFLLPVAKDEWWRCAESLHRLGLLTLVDIAPFAAYCQAYARWQQAEELLTAMGQGAMLVRTATGGAVQNPLLRVAFTAASDMVRYAAEFGLTPAARTRVANGVAARMAPSKFDGLLG
jgi:P27 family predicted phage terminase small subunit